MLFLRYGSHQRSDDALSEKGQPRGGGCQYLRPCPPFPGGVYEAFRRGGYLCEGPTGYGRDRRAIRENTDLIYLKALPPIFPGTDLSKIAEIAKRHHAATVIDNTYCTPIFSEAPHLGIDMVVHSASKYLGGHSDIIGGVVIGRKEDIDQDRPERKREPFGAVMSPFDSWLMLRGIRTLPVRMKQHMANAMEMAAISRNFLL